MSESRPVILVTGPDLADQATAMLKDFEVIFAGKLCPHDQMLALAKRTNPVGIIVRYGNISADIMDAAPALKVISKHGSGTDTIDKDAATARSIVVKAATGVNAAAVAEQALALLLACAKSVPKLNARMHAGYWDKATHKSMELRGRTIGLIGLGAIGQRFAKMADALQMRVLGFDPCASELPAFIQQADIDTIQKECDVISLHCPLTADNRNLVDARFLSSCKTGLILINTARGGLIDEKALCAALHSGQVSMAGLDSFAVEPFKTPHSFQHNEQLILSPHIGGVTAEAYVNMGVAAAKNVLEVLVT